MPNQNPVPVPLLPVIVIFAPTSIVPVFVSKQKEGKGLISTTISGQSKAVQLDNSIISGQLLALLIINSIVTTVFAVKPVIR